MSERAGILEESLFCEDTNAVASDTIVNASTDPITIAELEGVTLETYEHRTANAPIEMLEAEHGGEKIDSFLDDFYYRIHILKSGRVANTLWIELSPNFNLGVILTDIVEHFIVWNAYFTSKLCSQIEKVNEEQFELDGLTAPFNLDQLQYTTYTLTIPILGDPQFTSYIQFDFPDESPIVTISGLRNLVFSYKPLQPMKESLEWLTEIIQAKDGSEQRIALRKAPRQGFGLSCRFETHQEQAKFEALLFKMQKRSWGVPVWPEWVLHTSTIAAGATSVSVDTTNADFRANSLALIWKSNTEYEVLVVSSVTSNSLVLSSPVLSNWTGTKIIMPIRLAQMNTTVTRKDTPDGDAIMNFNFAVKDNLLLTGYAAPTTYKGLPVLTKASYVDGAQDKISDADIIVSDYETGAFNIYSDNLFNKNTQSHLFKNFNKADAWQFRKLLHSLCGQQGLVWIPSFKEDMILTDTIGTADVNFNIANISLSEHMGLNALRTHVAFLLDDGTMLFREITGITESGEDEIVSIDSALGVEVPVGGCMICFLDKYRLNSDKVDIDWDHPGWNTAAVQFLRVKA